MTKDWDAFQDEIKELSFNQRKPLEEVKELMENKYKFRASTRAYRMKLKEWGLMRQKYRRPRPDQSRANSSGREKDDDEHRASSATAGPMSIEPESLEQRTKSGCWQVVSSSKLATAEPTLMGLLSQETNLQPTIEILTWLQDSPVVSSNLLDMIGCVLDNECEKLEKLLMENVNEVNKPIGMPFESTTSRFYDHPAMDHMVIMQHPRQTLLDIACGMPNGPVVWVLLSYGAKGSTHPLGTDLALHNAIKNGRHYTVQALLVPGRSDVNGVPDKRWSPLLQAVFWTGPEVVNVLLKRGARVDDPGPSPTSLGLHTALQLCLERRSREYSDEAVRSQCNGNLKSLLNAGASIHFPPPEGSFASPFEMFIEPWQSQDHWNMKLSLVEIDCLGKFVEQGADLAARFVGCPCAAQMGDSFAHQVIWHSSRVVSRRVLDNFSATAPSSGSFLLHEVVGACSDANRHLPEILKDVEVLLKGGVDPNVVPGFGTSPLRKCIELSQPADIAAIVQKLLDGGADPEYVDEEGMQPYVVAASNLEDPLRSEVLEAMLAKMRGRHTRTKDNVPGRWKDGIFPIPEHPSLQQVELCMKPNSDFGNSMQEMVPADVQPAFRRAYLAVISDRLIKSITKQAVSSLSERNKWELMSVLALRNVARLHDYSFPQALVISLLDFPRIRTADLERTTPPPAPHDSTSSESTTPSPPDSTMTGPLPAFPPFQLNTAASSTLPRPPPAARPSHPADPSTDAFVGDTTQIRWRDPEAKRAPGDTAKAVAKVLQYKCVTCADGRLLTGVEIRRHWLEHVHAAGCEEGGCEEGGCARRFCREGRGRGTERGCQFHLFTGSI
ncbi:ankyrin [Lizonia empirigonia]|nr:ankyrin [Lizonia empirigonia]